MKLSELKRHLSELTSLSFKQMNGEKIPAHFHITEMGLSSKHFIDCGGEIRNEKYANLQIWVAQDTEHRLRPSGLLNIIEVSRKILGDEDLEIEIEYQTETIGKYALAYENGDFILMPKHTDCLAKSTCGVEEPKQKLVLSELGPIKEECCTPGGNCC